MSDRIGEVILVVVFVAFFFAIVSMFALIGAVAIFLIWNLLSAI